MAQTLIRLLLRSALVALVAFAALWLAGWLFPDLFSIAIEWWLLPLIFLASALPRLIGLLISPLFRPKGGGRKT